MELRSRIGDVSNFKEQKGSVILEKAGEDGLGVWGEPVLIDQIVDEEYFRV